jgi:hypothetical protein
MEAIIKKDRKNITTILKDAGLQPISPGKRGQYVLHYRKNQTEGDRFILNCSAMTDELRLVLANADITSTLLIRAE